MMDTEDRGLIFQNMNIINMNISLSLKKDFPLHQSHFHKQQESL